MTDFLLTLPFASGVTTGRKGVSAHETFKNEAVQPQAGGMTNLAIPTEEE